MKVFVSSTVYDLLDVRAEVSALLTSMGISPVLSDEKLSDFETTHDTNSIETCLINLEDSDEVIIILDQRYGTRLGKWGFEDISATHLEYKKARELRKPLHVFVRDRLEADFTTWKKNRKNRDLKLPWVDSADFGLFDLLEDHRSLRSTKDKNWFSIFTNGIDLKQGIRRILEPKIKPRRVIEAMSENRFPLITVDHESDYMTAGNVPTVKFAVRVKNVGGAPAFNFTFTFDLEDVKTSTRDVVAPGQTVERFIMANATLGNPVIDGTMSLQFDSIIGVQVRETYRVHAMIQGGIRPMILGGVVFRQRTFHNAPELKITITDD